MCYRDTEEENIYCSDHENREDKATIAKMCNFPGCFDKLIVIIPNINFTQTQGTEDLPFLQHGVAYTVWFRTQWFDW